MAVPETQAHLFVVFGGTGDLFSRKLLPAIHNMVSSGLYEEGQCHVLAVARSEEYDDYAFRQRCRQALEEAGVPKEDIRSGWCDRNIHYQVIGQAREEDFLALGERIEEVERVANLPGNRIIYLALPPGAFPPTIEGLGKAGLNQSPGWTRLVVEKPFGHDLASARQLNAVVHRHFDESQVYRIDHYLGKETVQNLLVFRFSNTIFESLWNRDRIERVEITVAESLGVEDRAGYYDKSGALRDMVQNHVSQLISLVAMEVPTTFSANAVRYEKIKVLRSIQALSNRDVAFGQYAAGHLEGPQVAGYLDEPGVAPGSQTETFVAMRLDIQTWRWQGVPFFVRTGKRMPKRVTRIVVTFRTPPVCLFENLGACMVQPNQLIVRLQPDEGFEMYFDVKVPGDPFAIQRHPFRFDYEETFGKLPDAYQTLLIDVASGDQTLFVHGDEVEAAWSLYDPLLQRSRQIHPYPSGTWGPAASDQLLASRGAVWTPL